GLPNLRKTALQGGFFVSRARDYDADRKDLKKILYKLDIQPHKEEYLNHLGICIGRITSHISLLPAWHHTLTIAPRA
ncbi:hypothetical protein, partial [Mycoplasmoides pneumoniae]|uniref:hypothetical protein n=1 Tax=Mycoplasmoides pneumoniae TaxID=2104 RepID=UPI001F3178E3